MSFILQGVMIMEKALINISDITYVTPLPKVYMIQLKFTVSHVCRNKKNSRAKYYWMNRRCVH
jgi:hypothetical protein